MKKIRFADEQMVRILRDADTTSVAVVAKKHGVSEPTIYAWRKRFWTLEAMDVKRPKATEFERPSHQPDRAQGDVACPVGIDGIAAETCLGTLPHNISAWPRKRVTSLSLSLSLREIQPASMPRARHARWHCNISDVLP